MNSLPARERDRICELEALDVVLVDAGERREALAVIGAVIHQPVLRLPIRIEQSVRRYVGGESGRRQHAGREQGISDRPIVSRHDLLPFLLIQAWSRSEIRAKLNPS